MVSVQKKRHYPSRGLHGPVSDLQIDVVVSASGLTNKVFSPQNIESVQIRDLAIRNFGCQSYRNSRNSS